MHNFFGYPWLSILLRASIFCAVFASSLQVVLSACYKSIDLIALEGLALELSSDYFDLYLPVAFCFVSLEPGPEA